MTDDEPLRLDAYDADWIKRGRLDLPRFSSAEAFARWLESIGWSVEAFKLSEAYRANVDKIDWLRDL